MGRRHRHWIKAHRTKSNESRLRQNMHFLAKCSPNTGKVKTRVNGFLALRRLN